METTQLPAEAATALDRWLGGGRWEALPVAGDASTRQYFRIRSSGSSVTSILTYYPPDTRDALGRFLSANEALRPFVSVPEIRAHDDAVVLQQDVGDRPLASLLSDDSEGAIARYTEAAEILDQFAGITGPGCGINPPFDKTKFLEELEMSRRFFVEEMARADGGALEPCFSRLAERLTKHPYTLCHRDYHGQNIYIDNDTLYVIDYQDMRVGPDTYDLASLVRDRGVWRHLGPELEARLIARHAARRGEAERDVRRRYLEALLQRSIKAIGTFARLVVVYGRRQYLAYIEPTLETVRECSSELEEWQELLTLFPFDYDTP